MLSNANIATNLGFYPKKQPSSVQMPYKVPVEFFGCL
jgi:hypothetical protein